MIPDELRALAWDAASDYSRQPVNFGRDDEDTRIAAHDGFEAGFEAGVKAGLALAEGSAS